MIQSVLCGDQAWIYEISLWKSYEPISGKLGSGNHVVASRGWQADKQAVETAAQAAGGPVVLLLGPRVLFMGPEPNVINSEWFFPPFKWPKINEWVLLGHFIPIFVESHVSYGVYINQKNHRCDFHCGCLLPPRRRSTFQWPSSTTTSYGGECVSVKRGIASWVGWLVFVYLVGDFLLILPC